MKHIDNQIQTIAGHCLRQIEKIVLASTKSRYSLVLSQLEILGKFAIQSKSDVYLSMIRQSKIVLNNKFGKGVKP